MHINLKGSLTTIGVVIGIVLGAFAIWQQIVLPYWENKQLHLQINSIVLTTLPVSWGDVYKKHGPALDYPLAERIFRDQQNIGAYHIQPGQSHQSLKWSELTVFGITTRLQMSNPTGSNITVHSCVLLLPTATNVLQIYFIGDSMEDLMRAVSQPVSLQPGQVLIQPLTFLLVVPNGKLSGAHSGDGPPVRLQCFDQENKRHEARFPFNIEFRRS